MILRQLGCKLEEETRKGLQEKGLQSRSVTASLLIKNLQCTKEKIKLIDLLAQKSRHTASTHVVSL